MQPQDSPWPVPRDRPPSPHLPPPDRPPISELTTPTQRRRAAIGVVIGVVGLVALFIAGNLLWAYCNPRAITVDGPS